MKLFTNKTIWLFLVVGILFNPLPSSAGGTSADLLEGLIKEALANNPQVQENYNLWKAEEYKVKSVQSLDNPMVGVSLPGEHIQTRIGPQERKYSFSQKVPFPGKRGLKGKAQSKQARAAMQRYEAAKREIIKEVKFVFYDLFWIDQSIALTEEEKTALDNLASVALRKYEADLIPQQDVVKAQFELSRIEDKLYTLNQQRKSLQAKLNSLLDRSPDTPVEAVTDVDAQEFGYTLGDLDAMAEDSRQELAAAELAVEKAEFEYSLAKREYLPDFSVGVEYIEIGAGTTTRPDDGQDAWMGMISVNLPIWFGKNQAQIREKNAGIEASKSRLETLKNTVDYEVQDMYFKIASYKNILELYETALIPQAQQSFDTAGTAYEAGETDFLNWLDAERKLIQTQMAYYKSIVDYNKSVAFMERIAGRDL